MAEETKQLDELKSLLQEVVGASTAEIKEAQQETSEQIKEFEERFGSMNDRLSELENVGWGTLRKPATLPVNTADPSGQPTNIYRGFNLDIQGSLLRAKTETYPQLKVESKIINSERREEYAKWLIDLIRAKQGDPEARSRMNMIKTGSNQLMEGTDAYGGATVPENFASEILAFARLTSVCLTDCTMYSMGTDVLKVPAELTGVAVVWEGEGDAGAESDPTTVLRTLTATRVGAFSVASNEFLQDSNLDVVSWLTSQYAEALGQEIDKQVFQGTGTPVSGLTTSTIIAAANTVQVAGSMSTVLPEDLSEMISKVPPNRIAGAKWYLHRAFLHYIRRLNASGAANTDITPVFAPIASPTPSGIYGYPYMEVEQFPSTEGAYNPYAIFGNLAYYLLGRRLQTTSMDVDPYGKFTEYETRFRMYWRFAFDSGLNPFICLRQAG
jgi:HK97 family phage major capsid protein